MANGSLGSYRSSLAELSSAGIRSRTVAGVNGLTVHLLEAGRQSERRPLLVLLHGFPELGYSWRKVMPALADAGYYVIAPDQRGYGATTGWDASFDGDLAPFRMFNLVRDVLGIVAALGYERVHAVIGHDAGAGVAGWCSLLRPDIFSAVAMMSAPFSGPPQRRPVPDGRPPMAEFDARLAALEPARKHYQWYYSSRRANADMMECPRGLHAFLRGYYHYKSADWPGNTPYRLRGWTATELAKLPTYYVMNRGDTMPEAVAPFTPSPKAAAACRWLPDEDLAVYCAAYAATGFQGGLQWYRCGTARRRGGGAADLRRAHHRRALLLHLRRRRLGRVPESRRLRTHARRGVHAHARLPPAARRRPLGAAGAARAGHRAAPGVPAHRQLGVASRAAAGVTAACGTSLTEPATRAVVAGEARAPVSCSSTSRSDRAGRSLTASASHVLPVSATA